ncbi:DNA-binding protein [Nanobdella aerobiophila]|uniref:DNA-binding protein n=1 Tax=Nanobdella aerobiophila TaxID=2586965 RepID=A0A915SZF4_9ARCH|nr:DUF655 domain-containing protein [Nanobdella aerobiophila]BBL45214.1 DNA-binding protein [Nanobdella aerobiophila]
MYKKNLKKEDIAIVIAYLPGGDVTRNIREPVVYAVGKEYFTLLILTLKPSVTVNLFEELYIGDQQRPKVRSILRRISIDDLPEIARPNLEKVIKDIIKNNESKYVNFFNTAGSINIKIHSLELLPNIGKIIVQRIIEERQKKPFESFKDIEERVKGIGDVQELIYKRILLELTGKEKIKIFTL